MVRNSEAIPRTGRRIASQIAPDTSAACTVYRDFHALRLPKQVSLDRLMTRLDVNLGLYPGTDNS